MSNRTVLALFVGGPWDGRREEIAFVDSIRVPVFDPPTLIPKFSSPCIEDAFGKIVVYRRTMFAGQTMRFVIYAEESLTGDDVMGMLWDGYAPVARPKEIGT